ncbi:hypothetical protein JHK87_048276 [Glycine soja]|nr:hypothetical protein JHK87_048276 [Glycine soja]
MAVHSDLASLEKKSSNEASGAIQDELQHGSIAKPFWAYNKDQMGCLRTAYTLNQGMGWTVLAWIFSISTTIFSTYWDLVLDWGFLQRHSKNCWLRDKLLIPHKSVYFAAMPPHPTLRYEADVTFEDNVSATTTSRFSERHPHATRSSGGRFGCRGEGAVRRSVGIFRSAHGMPLAYVEEADDPYKAKMEECVDLIMEELEKTKITNAYTLAY